MKTVYEKYITDCFLDLDSVSKTLVCQAQDIVRRKTGIEIGGKRIFDCYLCVICGDTPLNTYIVIRNQNGEDLALYKGGYFYNVDSGNVSKLI